jgi:hypothetical protein
MSNLSSQTLTYSPFGSQRSIASQSKNRQLSGLVLDGTPMSQRRKDADFTGSTDLLGKSRSNKRSRQNIIPDLSEDESEEPDKEVDRTPPPAKKPRVTPKTTKVSLKSACKVVC